VVVEDDASSGVSAGEDELSSGDDLAVFLAILALDEIKFANQVTFRSCS
jgi:hypothetical protein